MYSLRGSTAREWGRAIFGKLEHARCDEINLGCTGAMRVKVGALSVCIELNKALDDKAAPIPQRRWRLETLRSSADLAHRRDSRHERLSARQAEIFEACVGCYERLRYLHCGKPVYKVPPQPAPSGESPGSPPLRFPR
jgi:hypothetical protein